MTGARRLVINADDLGLTEGVNRGILEAHAAGVVTSASLLVNTPGFADAVTAARRAPALGVGLHFNVTVGRPVAPPHSVSSLCDRRTGEFCGLPRLAVRALAGRVVAAQVAAECAAQIDRLRRAGLAVTHLDAHHHAHVLPGMWQPTLEAARGAGIGFVRVPLEPVGSMAWRPVAAAAQALIATSHRLASRGTPLPRHADHFCGFALTGRRDFRARLLALLERLEPGVTELMVHPGHCDAALAAWAWYTGGRERELAALTDPAVRARLGRGDVELVNYSIADCGSRNAD